MNIKLIIYHLSFIIRKSAGFTQHPTPRSSERGSTQCSQGENSQNPDRKVVGAGFTLIELMVVISITAILGTLGIAGFTNFNRTQVFQAASNEVVTILNLAKSRAQSQIKPPALCGSLQILDGYEVKITKPKDYALYLRCSGSSKQVDEWAKTLPNDINFGSDISFFFPIQTGGVKATDSLGAPLPEPWSIVISGYGRSKTMTINPLGGVSMQ